MNRMIIARATEVTGEELKTVSFEGTIRHREASPPKKAASPPRAQIMGRNQAAEVTPSAEIPSRILFSGPRRREKRNNGPKKRMEDGRTPAAMPRTMAVGTR